MSAGRRTNPALEYRRRVMLDAAWKIRHQYMMLSFFFLCAFVLVAQVPSATQVVPEDIPGIVKAGTKIELVKGGLDGTDDPIGLPDGTTLFTEPPANRIWKIDQTGRISVFRENSNGR